MEIKKYKFVHIYIVPVENSYSNIRLLEKVFNENDDTAFVISIPIEKLPDDLKSFKNIYTMYQEGDKDVFYWLKNCEKCYFHFFRYDNKTYLKLLLKPWLQNKCVWIEWGGDLFSSENTSKGIIHNISNKLRRYVLRRFKRVVCIFEPDIDYYYNEFKGKGKVLFNPYSGEVSLKEIPPVDLASVPCIRSSLEAKGHLDFLIGHRASEELNHKYIINLLAKFKDESFILHFPISYGNREYGEEIIKYAQDIFGEERVVAYRELLPIDQYKKMMKKIDIGFFYTERQIALGNIGILLEDNKKIYLKDGSIMYNFFKTKGIDVYAAESIEVEDFQALINDCNIQAVNAYQEYKNEHRGEENLRRDWQKVKDF